MLVFSGRHCFFNLLFGSVLWHTFFLSNLFSVELHFIIIVLFLHVPNVQHISHIPNSPVRQSSIIIPVLLMGGGLSWKEKQNALFTY